MFDIFFRSAISGTAHVFAQNVDQSTVKVTKDAIRCACGDEMEVIVRDTGQYHVVQSYMNGADVIQEIATPHCCDVRSEAYWSM